MLVGVLTLGILTSAGIVVAAVQPPAPVLRTMLLVRPVDALTVPRARGISLHAVAEARAGAEDLDGAVEDPMLSSKRRAFRENGANCRTIGAQRCLSRPKALLTLR